VSPLIALMADQVAQLNEYNVSSTALYSGTPSIEGITMGVTSYL
jgi:superfamily II DNA helicase RecQ